MTKPKLISEIAEGLGVEPIGEKDAAYVLDTLEEAKMLVERVNTRHQIISEEKNFPEQYKRLRFEIWASYEEFKKGRMRIL